MIYIHHPIFFSDDKIKKNKVGGSCSKYGGEERYVQGIGGEICKKETT